MALFAEGKLFREAGTGSGGGDKHNKGYFVNESALTTAYPTAEAGDYAIVESTDTVWIWDSDNSEWVDSDQKGQVTSVNGQTGDVTLTASDVGAATTAQGAKADTAVQPADLATVATTGDYDDLLNKPTIPDPLPSQTGQSGKFLTTDGTDASWSDKPLVNSATYPSGNIQIGSGSNQNGVIVGYGSQIFLDNVSGSGSVVIGNNSQTRGRGCVAIGYGAKAGSGVAGLGNTVQIGAGQAQNGTVQIFSYKLFDSDGTIPADRLTHAINKYSAMPTASADNLGWIVQFTGTTDSTYTHGHLYECVSDGADPATYSWTEVSMGGGSSYTAGTGIDITGTTISTEIPMAISSTDTTAPTVVASATGSGIIAIGPNARAGGSSFGNNAIAIGENATAYGTSSGQNSVVVGGGSTAQGTGSVVVGANCHSGTGFGVAIGYSVRAGNGGVILGCEFTGTQVTGTNGGFDVVLYNTSTYSSTLYNVMTKDGQINPDRLGTGYDPSKTQTLKNVQGVLTWVDDQ